MFLHDRVQEAAYALIPEGERAAVHLRIGRLFVSRTAPEEIEEKIFEIVNQLNRGTELIHSLEERERVAELNLIAGKRAKSSTAYASALTYFVAGRSLLAEERWAERYALTFTLEVHRAECEFLTGDFSTAEERLLMLSHRSQDLAKSAIVARLQTELYTALDQSERAVAVGLEYLRRAGVEWPPHPTNDEVRQEYERIWQQLGNRPIEALIDLPAMTDPAWGATLDVLTAVEEPAHDISKNLQSLIIARIVNLSLERGNSDGSGVAYVQLGRLLVSRFGDYQAGFRFGKLGLDLVEKRGLERFRTRVSQRFGYFVNPWSKHFRTSVELLRRSFATAQEAGDLRYVAYSCDRLVTLLLAAGDPLGDVQREAENGLQFAQRSILLTSSTSSSDSSGLFGLFWARPRACPPSAIRSSTKAGSSNTWKPIRTRSSLGAGIGSASCKRTFTLAKASQAVSSELDLDKLIETLLLIALENAGAHRGVLILLRGDESQIEAEAITGHDAVTVTFHRALPTSLELPESILRYVIRTQESIILDDASAPNQFSEDEYVQRKQVRSILCLPLVKQANLKGALYLENNLASHVFTPKRILLLRLLVSQASISLDHARLYADLTQENNDRRRAEEALRVSEERLQDIVDNTSAVIFVKNLDLRYILVNRGYERLHDVQRDQVRGKTDFDIHPHHFAERARANDRQVIAAGGPIQFEQAVPVAEGERHYVVVKFLLRDGRGKAYAICGIATDITDLKRAAENIRVHAVKLSQANELLKHSLNGLAREKNLQGFVHQVLVALTEQLGGHSSTLWLVDVEKRIRYLQLVCQDGRVVAAKDSDHPNAREPNEVSSADPGWIALQMKRPFLHYDAVNDPKYSPAQRAYLSNLGIKSLLWIPLLFGGQLIGMLSVRIAVNRQVNEEDFEFAQALAQQVTLALELERLAEQAKHTAREARQTAVLAERNALAGEIHDSLAQSFVAIAMHLDVAEVAPSKAKGLHHIHRANELAQFGLAEARRSVLSLRSGIQPGGLVKAIQQLVERSNVPGILRCELRSEDVPDESIPPEVQHELVRICQETISNAVRHAKPTVITATLRWNTPNLLLQITDNGCGTTRNRLEQSEGFGMVNMRARVAKLGGKLQIETGAGRGTSIIVTLQLGS
jgi:PAS domain S-box-containing protein